MPDKKLASSLDYDSSDDDSVESVLEDDDCVDTFEYTTSTGATVRTSVKILLDDGKVR